MTADTGSSWALQWIAPQQGGAVTINVAAGGVRYEQWMKFTVPLYLGLVALGGISIAVAIAVNLQ